jgi:hypothetical protein
MVLQHGRAGSANGAAVAKEIEICMTYFFL